MTRLAMKVGLAAAFSIGFGLQGAKSQTPGPLSTYPATQPAGRTLFNVASRLGILNLISAYALALDNSDADAWFKLFADDAVFTAGNPGEPPVVLSGDEFRKTWRDRIEAFTKTGVKRRHLLSNVVLLEETPIKAHVSVVGLLTETLDGKSFKPLATLNDEAWLINRNGDWKIQRWNDFPDSRVE